MANAVLLEPMVPASISMFGSLPGYDFSGASLPTGVTLTRSSTAYRWNNSGLLASAANDVARFDYDPVGHALLGLLIEPAATNLLLQSQALDNAAWTANAMTVTGNAAGADDGTTTGEVLTPTTSNVVHSVDQPGLAVSGGTATHSVFVKANGYSKVSLKEGSTTGQYASFDLGAGSVIGSTSAGATIAALPGGWYRITMTVTAATTQGFRLLVLPSSYVGGDPNGAAFAGNGTSGIYAWQAQLETGALATSIVPTTSAAATRAADAGSIDWGALGAANGSNTVRYTFDDGSTQDVATTISGGTATIPTNLNRRWVMKAQVVSSTGVPDIGAASNLLTDYAGVTAQTACAIGATNQAIIAIDLGADTAIDMILVFGVELFPASGALKINYATAAQGNFTGSYSTDASGSAYAGSAAMTTGKGVSFWRLASPVTARYVQIVYEAGTGVTGKSVKASRVVIGKSIQMQRNFSYGGGPGVKDLGALDFSRRGVLQRTFGKKLRTQQITFSNARKDEVQASLRPLEERLGNTAMLALVTDPAVDADRQNKCYYGALVGDLGIVQRNAIGWETKLNLLSVF